MQTNKKMRLVETKHESLRQGALPEGCEACVRGEKLVLFVTGLCPASCFFCPLSDEKKNHDVMYANEQELEGSTEEQIRQMITEAKLNRAKGAGITGGDPLTRLDRTCAYIRALKAEFGKGFHIHLYTPLILVNEITMKKLHEAGLDEIRFHPSLESERFWDRMAIARKYPWEMGIEIPILPDKVPMTKRLVEYAAERKLIDFLNLNELEISERTAEVFLDRGYELLRQDSYAIKGSKQAALEILKAARDHGVRAHFCTVRLKDRVQMGNRIKRRAETVAQKFDIIDDEGLLTRGAIYLDYPPSYSYTRQLKDITAQERAKEEIKLKRILDWLHAQGMPKDAGMIDAQRLRIVLGAEAMRAMADDVKGKFPDATCVVITEYPTADTFIVEMDEL